jgi:hypothetical protein
LSRRGRSHGHGHVQRDADALEEDMDFIAERIRDFLSRNVT